jgi:hypothetical protein
MADRLALAKNKKYIAVSTAPSINSPESRTPDLPTASTWMG